MVAIVLLRKDGRGTFIASFTLVLFFLVVMSFSVFAGTSSCDTPACPSGYLDNGTSCNATDCVRECFVPVCDLDWTEVGGSPFGGLSITGSAFRATDTTTSGYYAPTDRGLCYRFMYDGPEPSSANINTIVSAPPSGDCDSEAVGGFQEWSDGAKSSSPWFSGMTNYVAQPDDPDVAYFMKIARAHHDESADPTYRGDAVADGYMYCANTTLACADLENNLSLSGSWCDTDCYNKETRVFFAQGYLVDETPTDDGTLYDWDSCGLLGGLVSSNKMVNLNLRVYSSSTHSFHNNAACALTPKQDILDAIELGISNALTNYTLFEDQEIYVRLSSENQTFGTFDRAVIKGDKYWGFNYVFENESAMNMTGIGNILFFWENMSLEPVNVTWQVEAFINATK